MAKIVLNNEESDPLISTQALGAVLSHKDDPKQGPKHDKKSGDKSQTRTVRDGSLSPGFLFFSDTIFGTTNEYYFGTTPIPKTMSTVEQRMHNIKPKNHKNIPPCNFFTVTPQKKFHRLLKKKKQTKKCNKTKIKIISVSIKKNLQFLYVDS